jgi:two-component system, OmpR family, sensor kinase
VSLRGRIIAAFAYLLLLAVIALAVPLALNIERRAIDDAAAGLGGQAQVIASSVSGVVARGNAGDRLDEAVEDYADDIDSEVLVTDIEGRVLAASGAPGLGAGVVPPEIARALDGARVRTERGGTLFVAVPVIDRGLQVGAVRLAEDTGELTSGVRRSWLVLGAVGAVVIVAGMGVAWALASSLARPLKNLASTAHELGTGRLSARAPEGGPAEANEVALALNRMAEDLSAAMDSQRDFIANASHQLRTPLTGVRIRLESIVAGAGPEAASAEAALKEVDRLSELVEDLLLLARATEPATTGTSVDMADIARDSAERWRPRAAENEQEVVARAPGSVVAWTDAEEVARVFDNLIENAIAYCPPGTRIEVAARNGDGRAILSVADDGPGIPDTERARVFERFFRGQTGRRSGPGTGLGLAIVKEIADRWGAGVDLESRPGGTTVTIAWPALPTLNRPVGKS